MLFFFNRGIVAKNLGLITQMLADRRLAFEYIEKIPNWENILNRRGRKSVATIAHSAGVIERNFSYYKTGPIPL